MNTSGLGAATTCSHVAHVSARAHKWLATGSLGTYGVVVRRQVRDRHGRGQREIRTAQSFDLAVLDTVDHLKNAWASSLKGIDFATAEVPTGEDLDGECIKLATVELVNGRSRVTVFRRPIELRSETRAQVEELVFATIVEQVAELLGLDPADVDEDYGID